MILFFIFIIFYICIYLSLFVLMSSLLALISSYDYIVEIIEP